MPIKNLKKPEIKNEILGGLTTFFTMAYIVIVNPSILSTQGTGMPFNAVLTATVALAFSMTLMMGLYAKLPFAVAPGMGINAFFTYTLILGYGVHWSVALGMVFWAGVLFLLASVTPLRVMIAQAIPENLRSASAAGIGLFLTFIGLKNLGIVQADPVTFVKAGVLNAKSMAGILGMVLSLWLFRKKNPFAFLAGIFSVTVLALALGWVSMPAKVLSTPDFTTLAFKLDIWGALKLSFLPAILSVFFTDLFDSISTFVGVSQATGLLEKNGQPKNLKEGLIVDSFATLGAGLLGTSSGTAYIESSAGIEVGGRTGLASVVTALCFLPCFFIAPLAGLVPEYATAPVLLIVGVLMFKSVKSLSLEKLEDAVPAFLTIALIPLTFSITQGILWGFLAHVVLYWGAGRRREIHPMLYAIAAISAGLLAMPSFT